MVTHTASAVSEVTAVEMNSAVNVYSMTSLRTLGLWKSQQFTQTVHCRCVQAVYLRQRIDTVSCGNFVQIIK